jgi:hypothetical protein
MRRDPFVPPFVPPVAPRLALRRLALPALALLAAAAVGLAACSQPSPAERVAELRGRYTVRLNSFVIEETPLGAAPAAAAGSEGGEGAAAPAAAPAAAAPGGEAAAGEEGGEGEAMAPPTRKDALLDVLLQSKASEALPGITLDVDLVDANKAEKAHYRLWVETAGMAKGESRSVVQRVEGVPYVDGDGFSVEIRQPVPAAERGDYREFADAG